MDQVNQMSLENKREDLGSDTSISVKREEALSYLLFLDEVAGRELARVWDVDVMTVPVLEISSPEQCLQCLTSFLESGIWPGYLFNRGDVWGIYITSLAEERFQKPLNLVMSLGGPGDLMLYLRACYRFGYQVVSDEEYDVLERFYLSTYPNLEFLNQHTNDDDVYTSVVKDAIKMSGVKGSKDSAPRRVDASGSYASLNSEKSTSVRPVRSYLEAYEYLCAAPVVRTHWSLKVDGFNTKCLFHQDGELDIALSRGRASDSWDYTEAVQRIIKVQGVNTSSIVGKVTGEAIVDPSALDYLRSKYPGKEYKSPKSTAGAMLRAPQMFDEADYKFLHYYPFDIEGTSKDVAFSLMRESGFTPPPDIVVEAGEVPLRTLEEFSAWLDTTILDPLWERGQSLNIGSDGVVLQLLTDVENDRADKYSDLNIALKFSHWTEAKYSSKVVKILFEQRRVEMSVVLEIEPVTTRDLNVATRVSVGSPAILVNDGVQIGDTIVFARKSEAINIYLGKR